MKIIIYLIILIKCKIKKLNNSGNYFYRMLSTKKTDIYIKNLESSVCEYVVIFMNLYFKTITNILVWFSAHISTNIYIL